MIIVQERKNALKYRSKRQVSTKNTEPSRTDQSFAQITDVNNIMANYVKTGQIKHLAKTQGLYADVSQIPDLDSALTQVTKAQQAFDNLPSHLRTRFGNSPVEFINFLQNNENREEAIKLGIIPKPPPTPPQELISEPQKTPKKQKTNIPNDDKLNDDE